MTNQDLPRLIEQAHDNAVKHGFYDGVQDNWSGRQERIMLIICEVAEFMEADRKGCWFINTSMFAEQELGNMVNGGDIQLVDFIDYYNAHVKQTAEEELADICIRCFDMLGYVKGQLDISGVKVEGLHIKVSESVPETCYQICYELIHCHLTAGLSYALFIVNEFCKLKGINIDLHIKAKMLYNQSRPYKHGKAY